MSRWSDVMDKALEWLDDRRIEPVKITVTVRTDKEGQRMRRALQREMEDLLPLTKFNYMPDALMQYYGVPFEIEVEPCPCCGRN